MATIANLTVRVSAQIAELQKSFTDATKATQAFQSGVSASSAKIEGDLGKLAKSAERFGDDFKKSLIGTTTVGTFLGNMLTKLASTIVSTLGGALSQAVQNAQAFQNAFLGLDSVAAAFGVNVTDARDAAKALSADGLIPLADSAKGLKSLLAKGFGLEDSVKLLNAFKDSAAFGRQAALSMGEAVAGAAEGLKNHNNALLDNAGMTKNLSAILKEAGYAMEDLDSATRGAGARQAAVAGILRETAAQAGDAARLTETYSGAVAALNASYESFLATMGESITTNKSLQIGITAIADLFRDLTTATHGNNTAMKLVADAAVFVMRAFANLLAVFDKLQRGFAEMDAALSGTVRLAIVGVGKMTDVIIDFLEFIDKAPNLGRALGFTEGYAPDIAKLKTFSDEVFQTQQHMRIEMEATQQRSAGMSTAIQGLITDVRTTANEMDAARGKSVELGESTTPAKMDRGGLDVLAKKAKVLAKEFPQLISQFEIAAQVQETFGGIGDFTIPTVGDLPGFQSDWLLAGVTEQTAEMSRVVNHELSNLPSEILPIFKGMFEEIPYLMRDVLSGDGGIGDVMAGIAGMAAGRFSETFATALARAKTPGGAPVTGGEKALGVAGVGIGSFMGGFAMGESGGKMKGALGGAASGAMMGAVAGPIGMGVGAVAGFVGGLFGGAKKAKEERKALEANKIALAEQYGGMENLRKIAGDLGVDISKAFDAKKPAQFEAAVKELNAALEDQKTRLEGLNTALAGVNDRATIFGDKFAKVFEATQGDDSGAAAKATAKMAAMAQASEAEFAGLGLMVRDTFAGLVKETGSGIAALQQMGPAFQVLEDGVSKWGLTSTAVIDELRANFALVNDTAFKPLFEQITATGNVLRGLMDAEALSPEGFQAIAADIGASLQGIANKGGDMSKALALSQPVLQKLWEAQEQYGEITDDTTSAILKQAEEQGLVGGQMKDTNQKILDVLLAIGNVLGADLPKYFEGLKKPADDAAMSIENSFSKIEIKPLTIGYRYDALNKPPEGVSVPHYAAGGIVRRPTLAMIGEAGPEAIVPLSGSALGAAATYETTIVLDGEVLAKSAAKRMPKYMREMGVGH